MSLYIYFLLYYIYHLCFTYIDFYDLSAWGGCWFVVYIVVVDVDCGLTSNSAIFQLNSDGTDVQFRNFDLLPGTHAMDSKGSLACRAYLNTGTGTSEDVFYLFAIRGPTRGEGKRGIEPGSSDPKSSPLTLRHRGRAVVDIRRFIYKFLNMCRFDYTAVAGGGKVEPVNQVNHTSWVGYSYSNCPS